VTAELIPRLLLFHKQSTSARTRFLRFADGLLAFAPLPREAVLRDESAPRAARLLDPAPVLKDAEKRLGLAAGSLRLESEFYAEVDTPDGEVTVVLAEFTSIDPPFAAAGGIDARFVALTETRDLPVLELQLARRAYTVILG
jgi:hypothetical protein